MKSDEAAAQKIDTAEPIAWEEREVEARAVEPKGVVVQGVVVQVADVPEPAPKEPAGQEPLALDAGEESSLTEPDDSAGPDAPHYLPLPEPDPGNRPPKWWPSNMLPKKGYRFPRGYDVMFLRIKAEWTSAKHKGDRYLILWEHADADEKFAYSRAMGDGNRTVGELAKQMVRFVDGHEADWSGEFGPGNIDTLWREVGAKGRNMLIRMHTQLHVLDKAEMQDFFANCVGRVRTV